MEMLSSPSQHQSHLSRFIIQPANRLSSRACGKHVCSMLRTLVWHYGDSLTLWRELHTALTHQQGNQAENSQVLCNINFFIEISIWLRGRKDFVSFACFLFFFLSISLKKGCVLFSKTTLKIYQLKYFILIFDILITL